MITIKPTAKIEFANSLRGIAVLLVLLGHYIFVFSSIKGQYGYFPKLESTPFPWSYSFLTLPFVENLNIGQVAVALFFLLSGFVIPNSIAALSKTSRGKVAFIIGRLLRIWPTYVVGLLISISALWLNGRINSVAVSFELTRVLANMSLFRDWLGQAQIDGVVWTLEIEAKFYLFVLLFWNAIGKGRFYPILLISIAALAAVPLGSLYDSTLEPAVTSANLLWTLPYLLYMSMGIVFNYHLRGIVNTQILLVVVTIMLAAFIWIAKNQGLYQQVPASYGTVVVVFGLMYFFAKDWSGGPIIRFFAKISFPLYASHAAFGYTGMAYMMSLGANPYLALALQVAVSTLVAWLMHSFIEAPTHNAGKTLGKRWAGAKAPAKALAEVI